jgi:hypothetical protein
MGLILGSHVRFRKDAAQRRNLSPNQVYRLVRLYRIPGDPGYRVVLDGLPAAHTVRLCELR